MAGPLRLGSKRGEAAGFDYEPDAETLAALAQLDHERLAEYEPTAEDMQAPWWPELDACLTSLRIASRNRGRGRPKPPIYAPRRGGRAPRPAATRRTRHGTRAGPSSSEDDAEGDAVPREPPGSVAHDARLEPPAAGSEGPA